MPAEASSYRLAGVTNSRARAQNPSPRSLNDTQPRLAKIT
jgi:hypothetical protein